MEKMLNVSSSPHLRDSKLTTGHVMYDVIIALMPVTIFGIYHFGFHAFLVLAVSIVTAVVTEFLFDLATHHPNTVKDGSAVLTGLLLGLCCSPTVPLYIPFLGSLFAIALVKCAFGGLGQNFMNPALAGRCFLLLSFSSAMTSYSVDGTSSATPLAILEEGGTVDVLDMFLGFTDGTICISIAAMLIGGAYLLITKGITWHIPVAYVGSFLICMIAFGGQGFDPMFLLAHLCGGGIVFGALFMATDPVTSPVTGTGQLIYGAVIGVLTAVFRVFGSSAESVSYAIILGNLVTPLIDRWVVPKPYGIGDGTKKEVSTGPKKFPKAAITLACITLIAGLALGLVNFMTADIIEEQNAAAKAASYVEVIPTADEVNYDDDLTALVDEAAAASDYYADSAFGKVKVNEAVVGTDASGNVVGYAISVSTADGYGDSITMSVGIDTEGTILGLSFTELEETAGLGMRADEDSFKSQFVGVQVDSFTLNKSGGSTADDEIDSISGASTTSGAVVNAVNAAIDFFANYIQ